MAKSILDSMGDKNLYRLHLWGGAKQRSNKGGGVDEYIGRAAHVRPGIYEYDYCHSTNIEPLQCITRLLQVVLVYYELQVDITEKS